MLGRAITTGVELRSTVLLPGVDGCIDFPLPAGFLPPLPLAWLSFLGVTSV